MPRLSYLAIAILLVAGCSSGRHQSANAGATITATAGTCGGRWQAQPAGREHFTVHNTGKISTRVTLIDATTGGIYGQVWELSSGTTRPLDVVIPAGNYRWRCTPKTGRATVSAAKKVHGKGGRGAKPLLPLSSEEINDAMAQYHTAVARGIGQLVAGTDRLRAVVHSGQLNLARQRWLTAHLEYERLGAAYGTFGDLDGVINGRPDGLAGGVHDPDFAGFLRVEYGLWHGESAKSLTPVVDALDKNVHKLAQQFPQLQIVPSDIPLRAHEILENTLQFELTGDTDMGSHTNLATAQANTDGSLMVLGVLIQQLRLRDAALETSCSKELAGFRRQLGQYDRGGVWEPLNSLSRTQREQLNGSLGQLLENLSLIPNILQMPPSTAPT
jgi:high-affinity iron transporter